MLVCKHEPHHGLFAVGFLSKTEAGPAGVSLGAAPVVPLDALLPPVVLVKRMSMDECQFSAAVRRYEC